MGGRKSQSRPNTSAHRTTRAQAAGSSSTSRSSAVPKEYRQMLREAGARPQGVVPPAENDEPPAKRLRRPGQRTAPRQAVEEASSIAEKPLDAPAVHRGPGISDEDVDDSDDNVEFEDVDDSDDNVEFEDVALPLPTIQTAYLNSEDEEDEDGEVEFDFGALPSQDSSSAGNSGVLHLELSTSSANNPKKTVAKRKPISKAERERRIEVHKIHICCLLIHAARRNRWCDDEQVQEFLRPLLSDKIVKLLKPRDDLSQFGRSESLKDGIQKARTLFQSAFRVTERGLKRALWAEEPSQLENYRLPDDLDSALDKKEFRKAAKHLDGSRDVGAQLFCALLRSVGVQARLVCSLQTLSFLSGAPTLPQPRPAKASKPNITRINRTDYDAVHFPVPSSLTSLPAARRLGHPNATAYVVPPLHQTSASSSVAQEQSHKPIKGESPFPVYWVEVLDEAHRKWQPVDPIVTCSQWRPARVEPPSADQTNSMCYAVAFASDGTATDVTRRYAKAYTSKTRKMRVDYLPAPMSNPSGPSGEEWLNLAMKYFSRPHGIVSSLDRIEESELTATASREPMPKNVADFKDHPVYALERHLRRDEVLIPGAQSSGTVKSGNKGHVERIYRRRDVRTAWSSEKWYRLGRIVRPDEEPVKILPRRAGPTGRGGFGMHDSSEEEEDPVLGSSGSSSGTPIFSSEQTDLFVPPPVANGKVPRNRFGNVDVFVPSMVPLGGVHINHELAARAAFLLGVDYAPALTGFEFKGRQGTAVLRGAVVAVEFEEAIRTVIEAIENHEAEANEERKQRRLLRMWAKFLKVLRIDERVFAGFDPTAESQRTMMGRADKGKQKEDVENMVVGPHDSADNEEDGDDSGGFIPPRDDEDEDDDMGGGFVVE